jgi:hypothetical protein
VSGLVGSVLVVVPLVGGKDLSSMGLVRDEDVVEDLTPDAAVDPPTVWLSPAGS